MQNLPHRLKQKDKSTYETISAEGSENYEKLYMSGTAMRDDISGYMGIPADDFNVVATMVYAFSDHQETFASIHTSGGIVRHIDVGTGPNLYTFIASLPYADELISIDLSPANVDRLKAAVGTGSSLAPYWHSWLEIITILYDIGSAEGLVKLDLDRPDLYDKLRHWPNLEPKERAKVRGAVKTRLTTSRPFINPYRSLNLEVELAKKLQPRSGDVIDDVDAFSDLVGTADICTKVFFSESIDDNIEVVAHAETNAIQFAKEGALCVSAHMSKTTGYKGFFTPEELAENPSRKLLELPATPAFFETLLGKLVTPIHSYRILWKNLENDPIERKMVRQDMLYGSAVIVCGIANHKNEDGSVKYKNGSELLHSLRGVLRSIKVSIDSHQNSTTIMHCVVGDLEAIIGKLMAPYFLPDHHPITISIASPLFMDIHPRENDFFEKTPT